MKRRSEWALGLVAIVMAGAILAAVTGVGPRIPGGGAPSGGPYFHAGKIAPISAEERGCLSKGCHVGAPHAKDRTLAAFRNMHARFVDCLVCHGREPRASWSVRPRPDGPTAGAGGPARKRLTIAASVPKIDRERMHGSIGPAVSCRGCHSERGSSEMAEAGIRDLGSGFANPVALRMIEEGAKQWIPDTVR